jgi:glycerol-3-phosphate dehydrogenase
MINHFLSNKWNTNLAPDQIIRGGGVITSEEVKKYFPQVDRINLMGGAIWYDAYMSDSQRILMQVLLWACNEGATALNYTEAMSLITKKNNVAGILAKDKETAIEYKFNTKVVVNAAGPWCREIATKFDKDGPFLFQPSLAWNVLFDKKALSSHALALTPKTLNNQTLFLVPWKERLMVGTGHIPWMGCTRDPEPSKEQLKAFIADINSTIPNIDLSYKDIVRVYAGLLPAKMQASADLRAREVILDHSKKGGPNGLYSISGVKFTTSRLVAEKVLKHIFPNLNVSSGKSKKYYFCNNQEKNCRGIFNYDWIPDDEDSTWKKNLRIIIENESVVHLDDFIFRRTSFADNPYRTNSSVQLLFQLFNWNEERFKSEVKRLSN